MRRLGAAWLSGLVCALALSGCAPTLMQADRGGYLPRNGTPPPAAATPHGVPEARPPLLAEPRTTGVLRLAALPGWADEDHVAALMVFVRACGLDRDPGLQAVCREAQALGPVDDATARRFLEARLRAEPLAGEGVLTGYFAPEYPARMAADADFSAAVRPRPDDMVATPPPPGEPPARKVVRQLGEDGQSWAYPDRAGIELTPPVQALAWMRPEDLFFMQVQGSGVLDLPDGRKLRATYAGDNGRPFVAIASAMVRRGLLRPDQASATAIRTWLRTHRDEAQPVMDIDPRYVFFSLQPDDGAEPAGAAGLKLTAGRSIAVDPAWHAYGEPAWIDGVAPVLAGAPRTYRRMVMALDTGSAIKGTVRADLYTGRGDAAGLEAGRIRHTLRMYKLVPAPDTSALRGDAPP